MTATASADPAIRVATPAAPSREALGGRAVLVEGEPFTARFRALDVRENLVFELSSASRTVAAQDLAYWGSYRDSPDHSLLVLADGGVLVADVERLTGENLTVYSPLCGAVQLPLATVKGVLLDPPLAPLRRDRVLAQISSAQGADDQLWLDNGDKISGTLKSWRAGGDSATADVAAIVLATKAREVQIAEDTVVAVVLNPALTQAPKPHLPAWELGFRDGTLLNVTKLVLTGDSPRVTLASGVELKLAAEAIPGELTWVRTRGERLVYLSSLQPLERIGYKHIPFLETPWALQADRNVLGGRLRCGGCVYSKGLGMHSTSRVAYDLNAQYRRFQAELALDDQAGRQGSVNFRVRLEDSQGQLQRAYDSPVVRGGMTPLPVTIDVTGARRLILTVDFADRGEVLDHANWLNARLIR